MPKTKVIINGNDYSELVSDLTTSIEFDKDFLIGNAPSMELTLKANNKNGEFNDLLDSPFILQREDGTKLGTFFVVKKPERMTKELSLTLYDSMYKANVEFDYGVIVTFDENPTVTIKDLLDVMAERLEVSIDYSLMNSYALDRIVGSYDSTEMIRSHLCWIGELGVGNFFADVDGNYVFKPLSKNKIHDLPPDDVEQFETIEDYLISGVMFTNEIVTIISGNEDNNIYRIDANNLYIDAQDDLDNIYSLLGGLTFVSSNALKCAHIEGLQLGEIINVADEFNIMPLSIKQTYLNATYDIQEISGEISTKNKEKVSDASNISKRIRRVQANIDQVNNQITFLVQDIGDTYASKTDLKITAEGISGEIQKTKTDIDGDIRKITDRVVSLEDGTTGFGRTYVTQEQYEDDMGNLVTTGRLTKYFRYDPDYEEYENKTGALLIGYKDDNNPTLVEAKVSPVGFALLENNTKMLWIEKSQTYLRNATIEGALQIGMNNGLKLLDEDQNGWSFTI